MAQTKEPIILAEDVLNIDGRILLRAGQSVTRTTLENMEQGDRSKTGLFAKTPFYDNFRTLLDDKEYSIPLENRDIVKQIVDLVGRVELTEGCARELLSLRRRSAVVYHHILATTLLVARCMLDVNPNEADVIAVARANLVKDLGMGRIPADLLKNRDHLSRKEFAMIRRHPVISLVLAYHYLGEGLDSMVALRHHERRGRGYPKVGADKPNHVVDLITAIDVFNALISPRSFRRESYDVRGAIDQIKDMADQGDLAAWSPRLLANIYRAEAADLDKVKLSTKKLGYVPRENYYGLAS